MRSVSIVPRPVVNRRRALARTAASLEARVLSSVVGAEAGRRDGREI
jgi:hypothetical protein